MSGHLHIARDRSESPIGDDQAGSGVAQDPAAWPVLREVEPPIRVVLADDHALMRRSLRLLLENEQDLEVIAEAGDLQTVTRHVREHRPHVLVLDLGLPNGSSIQEIGRLRTEAPGTQIVVLTMEESPVFAQQALDAGAIGFVLKEMADEDLPEAVRRAARGLHYVSPRVAATLSALRRSITQGRLSGRETEVVRLIALGYTSAEIADELHLSPRTVRLIASASTVSSVCARVGMWFATRSSMDCWRPDGLRALLFRRRRAQFGDDRSQALDPPLGFLHRFPDRRLRPTRISLPHGA